MSKPTDLPKEILAGVTTFATMSYILVVNPMILQAAGMDFHAVLFATAVAAAIGTFCMGWLAKYPFAVAPGMGFNAYFTYGVVLGEGYSWQAALAACFGAGMILFFLNVLGIRALIMNHIPKNLRLATIAGIGIFLAFIALQNLGLIVHNEETLVGIGEMRTHEVVFGGAALLVIAVLLSYNIPGAILIGILTTWLTGWFCGYVEWQGFFSLPPSPLPTLFALDLRALIDPAIIPIVLTYVFIGLFDATGTLLCLGHQGHFIDRQGHFPRIHKALFGDTIGTITGSLLGTSPATTYLESSAGIATGGRTGVTAFVIAFLLLLSLFFTPFVTSIPSYATAPVLLIIGAMMLQSLQGIEWHDWTELLPAFLILIAIPLTFSIAWGIALGFLFYPLLKLFSGRFREVSWVIWTLAFLFALTFYF